jgi:hypothetical protein
MAIMYSIKKTTLAQRRIYKIEVTIQWWKSKNKALFGYFKIIGTEGHNEMELSGTEWNKI